MPIVVSTELAVGTNRYLMTVIDRQNETLAAADRPVTLRFFELALNRDEPELTVAGTYMHILDALPGLYRAEVNFVSAGQWGVEVVTDEPDGSHRSGRLSFTVRESTTTPPLGAAAPASDTPTAQTAAQIAQISTDTNPDPDFYRLSIDDALANHEPFLLTFATPAFCKSATCGPALDVVKSVAAEFKDSVAFIHVEPYQLELVDGHLQPLFDARNQPIPVDAVNEWGLPTEPYTFAVDADGKVRVKLEGIAAPDELRQALQLISTGGG